MVQTSVWYYKGDRELASIAITMARASGSIGATEEEIGADGSVEKIATVCREGFQDDRYTLYGTV